MNSRLRITCGLIVAWLLALSPGLPAADEPTTNLVSLLAAGRPAIGVWTGALSAPRIAKVLATSDVDFIVADVEHGPAHAVAFGPVNAAYSPFAFITAN